MKRSNPICDDLDSDDFLHGDAFVLKTPSRIYVAVIGWDNDWTCYAGPSSRDWHEVKNNGDKIDYDLAESLFPAIVAHGLTWRD